MTVREAKLCVEFPAISSSEARRRLMRRSGEVWWTFGGGWPSERNVFAEACTDFSCATKNDAAHDVIAMLIPLLDATIAPCDLHSFACLASVLDSLVSVELFSAASGTHPSTLPFTTHCTLHCARA